MGSEDGSGGRAADLAADVALEEFRFLASTRDGNQQVAERRFNFFLTIVSVVTAGSVLLLESDPDALGEARLVVLVAWAVVTLLGLQTFLRVRRAQRAVARYTSRLNACRDYLVTRAHDPDLSVAIPPYAPQPNYHPFGLSGLPVLCTVVNTVLVGGVVGSFIRQTTSIVAAAVGAVAAAFAVLAWHVRTLARSISDDSDTTA